MYCNRNSYVFEKLQSILHRNKGSTVLIDSATDKQLYYLIPELKSFNDSRMLYTFFKLQDFPIPLELLYVLHRERILQLTSYMYLRINDIKKEMISALLYLSSTRADVVRPETAVKRRFILSEILMILLEIENPVDEKLLQITADIVRLFTEQNMRKLMDSNKATEVRNYLTDLLKCPVIIPLKLQNFFINHFCVMLNCDNELVSTGSVVNIQLNDCMLSHIPRRLKEFYDVIYSALGEQESFVQLMKIIVGNAFNWKSLLFAVSAYADKFQDTGTKRLKTFIDGLFQKAISECNDTILAISMLLIRQLCVQKVQTFPPYPAWFSSLQMKTEKSFAFFFSFLASLVPYESSLFLKIHINKVPFIPPNCQHVLVEYVTLAKTRLSDLNENVECIGLFNEFSLTNEKQESDVTRVLEHFRMTGEVMKTVLEAFVFRKSYYLKVFLPELLNSEELDENRIQFIEKLSSIGRIPPSQYRKWKSSMGEK